MVANSEIGDAPFASFHSSFYGGSTSLNGRDTIPHKDELHTSGYKAARLPRAPRSLLAAFVAISAAIFLVYICTLSIGKRLTAPSSRRRLAAKSGEGDCEESEDSSSIDSHAGTPSEGVPGVPTPLAPAVQDLHTQQRNAGFTFQTETTTLPSGKKGFQAATPELETQRAQTSHKRKGEEQSKVGNEAKQVKLAPPSEETQVQSPLPALDPDIDSFIDFVLSGGDYAFSEAFWLGDADPLHSTADPSIFAELLPLGGDPDLPHEDIGALGSADALPTRPSMLPTSHKERKEEEGAELPILTDSPDTQTQQGSPVAAGAAHRGPVPDTAEVSLRYYSIKILSTACYDANQQGREESSQAFTAEAFDALNEGLATNSGDTGVDTLPLSSRASPAAALQPSAVMVSLESDSTEQSASVTQLPTDANVISHFRWLGHLYPGVPDSVLKTHPFYRYPKTQPAPSTTPFDLQRVATFADIKIQASNALAVCRGIMGKPLLSQEDFQQLLFHTERLCGYAVSKMPVPYAGRRASDAIENLGIVFLVLDTLHCAAEMLGKFSMKHLWWPKIVRHIEKAGYEAGRDFMMPGKCLRNTKVARTLDTALEYYRQGHRPPVLMVVGLKEALLCEAGGRSKFSSTRWNAWREDAAQWRQSIVPSLASNKYLTSSVTSRRE
ncbi:hypothetical protein EBH_0049810 [Eimeria brunetti]|uniref:Transmembrane protein n=1 Tax=Eimeria brunetti TaxID=51314 RepID=U6LV46_9EIME|nr:hypothetical protein EBH_0049810 [Eimeria brunetti]